MCDPTNPVFSSDVNNPTVPTAYYRAVAEVDEKGNITYTDGNAYSGDNGRGAIKGGNGLYYMVGNDNNGNLSKSQMKTTVPGVELVNATGAELLYPGAPAPLPPNITMIGRLEYGTDKPGKDTNFRGLTIYNNTLYVAKGSGSNGYNTVYQVGTAGTLPTGSATTLATVPLTVLPGFPNTNASTSTAFPFGLWFAESYDAVCLRRGRWNAGVAGGEWQRCGHAVAADGWFAEVGAGGWYMDARIHSSEWAEHWRALQRGAVSSGA